MRFTLPRARPWWRAAAAGVLLGLMTGSAFAQPSPGQPTPGFSQDLPEADFLFGRPRAVLGLRGSLFLPREGSDLFEFVQDQLTIDRGDFRAFAFTADVAVPVSSRLDVVGGVDLSRRVIASEYRDFVDNQLLPIEQESQLRQNGIFASLRLALAPRGRQVGRFAWIPARVQPYVGVGGGLVFWEFRQTGDFVDFADFGVFADTFRASGTAPAAHVLGGLDIVAYKRLMLSVDGRYQWARGELSEDFVGFEPLDLSGFRAAVGISIAF